MKILLICSFVIAIPVRLLAIFIGVEYPSSGEGNTNSRAPFSYRSIEGSGVTGLRYQQVYEARRFNFFGNPAVLDYIGFRFDTPDGFSSMATYTNVQISVSTTLVSEGSLSPVFAQNIGGDQTVIFSGTFTWGNSYSPGLEPQHWDFVLRPTVPFVYDPALGNLLFEYQGAVSAQSPTGFSPFDAWRLVGDGTASVFGAPNSMTGTMDTIGLTTLFGFTVVPEPSTYLLLFVGGGVLWLIHTRNQDKKPKLKSLNYLSGQNPRPLGKLS